MHHLGALRSSASEQRGGVLVMIALFTPVAILFVAFVIDVGNWFDHKRQLQLRADAGALATARAFNSCFQSKDNADSSIYQLAGQYGGTSPIYTPSSVKNGPSFPYPGSGGLTVTGSLYNTSPAAVSPSNNTYSLVNSQRYANQTGAGSPLDSTVPATSADPCNAAMTDLKITETNLPWYMQALSVPFINAHARIQIKTETSGNNFLPFSVANTAPAAVTVYVVNEDITPGQPGYIMNTVSLTDQGLSPVTNGELFSNSGSPAPVAITQPHMGIIVAVSGGSSHTSCTDSAVQCFGGATVGKSTVWGGYPPNSSLVHIQGWSAAGTGTYSSPIARSVSLSSTTCGNAVAQGAYYSTATSDCTFTITAKLDVGSTTTGLTVTPIVGGTTQSSSMTYNSSTQLWTGTATLPANAQSTDVNLQVKCDKTVSNSACASATNSTVTIAGGPLQRADAADANTAGNVLNADITDSGQSQQDSFEVCESQDSNQCTRNLTFSVTTMPGLAPGPKYTMNFASGSNPNQTGIIGCNGGTSGANERTDIANSCTGMYQINTNDFPACANQPPSGPQPWDCLPGNSGIKEGPFFQGVNQRFEGSPTPSSCVNPNNYPNYPPNDPRIVSVFIVPFGYVAAGVNPLPIVQLAAFYVTGWDNNFDPCPTTGANADDVAGKDQIVGHFINYVNPLGGNGSGSCTFGALEECVAILTQ